MIEENNVTKKYSNDVFLGSVLRFHHVLSKKVNFLIKNSQILNQFHKRDFLGYAFNFSLKLVLLSIGKVKWYNKHTKHILVGCI